MVPQNEKSAPPPCQEISYHKSKLRMEKRYYRLLGLLSMLYELQPQAGVKHGYKEQLQERLKSRKYVELLDLLIRQVTLLNRTYRLKEQGVYQSERSDLVIALQLLERDIKVETMVSPALRLVYEQLRHGIGMDRVFTSREVMKLTGYGKSGVSDLLRKLAACSKLERKGGNRKIGYYYQLK